MATLGPGTFKCVDPRTQDPESAKKLASGFWKCEYRIENDETVWRCDKRGLEEAIYQIMRDRREAQFFSQDPTGYLDCKFGEGTGYAWGHRNRDGYSPYVDMRMSREREMDMYKYANYANTSGGTSTNTTATVTASGTAWMQEQYIKEEMYRNHALQNKQRSNAPTPPPASKKLVRNLPFVCGAGDLLNTLQRDFDYWTAPQKRILFA